MKTETRSVKKVEISCRLGWVAPYWKIEDSVTFLVLPYGFMQAVRLSVFFKIWRHGSISPLTFQRFRGFFFGFSGKTNKLITEV